jgi:hypothetical protein
MTEIFFWPLLTGCLCLEGKIRNDSIFLYNLFHNAALDLSFGVTHCRFFLY